MELIRVNLCKQNIAEINGTQYDSEKSADIATFYDIGG